MRLLEDYLTPEDRTAISKLLKCEEVRFDLLIMEVGLNPSVDFMHSNLRWVDFRGSDLRGFNFTGADLRFASKNESTNIDTSTIFDGAEIEWIDKEAVAVVRRMQEAQTASSANTRRKILAAMVEENGRTRHVVLYLLRALDQARSFEEFLDFAEYLPRSLSHDQKKTFKSSATKALARKNALSQRRTRRAGTANLAATPIVERLEAAANSVVGQIYENLARTLSHDPSFRSLAGIAQPTIGDIEQAISDL